jgi:chromosome segregation ATPase
MEGEEKKPEEKKEETPLEGKPAETAEKVETAIEKADEATEKAVDKISDLFDKVAAILLNPDTTAEQKKSLLSALEGLTPKLMEVTDKWLSLETELFSLKSSSQKKEEAEEVPQGEQTANSPASPVESMDQSPPAEIPVAEVAASPAAKPAGGLAELLRRIW